MKNKARSKIYPEYPVPKNKWMLYYKDLCSERGNYHLYYKFSGWNKGEYKPMCFTQKEIRDELLGKGQLTLI